MEVLGYAFIALMAAINAWLVCRVLYRWMANSVAASMTDEIEVDHGGSGERFADFDEEIDDDYGEAWEQERVRQLRAASRQR